MRLIDADALNIYDVSPADGFVVMGVTEEDIDLAPSIEIIRCRECKRAEHEPSGVRCGLSDVLMGEDGFCSIGERNCSEKPNNSKVSEKPTGSERSSE